MTTKTTVRARFRPLNFPQRDQSAHPARVTEKGKNRTTAPNKSPEGKAR